MIITTVIYKIYQDKFNTTLEILVNNNKGSEKNNGEYVTTDYFDTFYNDYIGFKHYIIDILKILNERNATSTKKAKSCR